MQSGWADKLFTRIAGSSDDASDLSEVAHKAEAPNALRHIASLCMTKVEIGRAHV